MSSKNNSIKGSREKRAESHHIIWTIYFRDLKRIFLNPVAAFIVVAIFFLPGLYAWCGIGANWDPYGNVNQMKVALVNEDVPVESELAGTLDIGNKLVDKLKDNKNVDWCFMDRQEAMDKIEHDYVYAVIVIPNHFSSDFAALFKGEDVRDFCKFELYVNERRSQVGIKVGDTIGSTVESTINTVFRGAVSSVLAAKTTELTQKGLTGTSEVVTTVSSRLRMISDTIASLDGTMSLSANGVQNVKDTITKTTKTLNEVKSQFPAINSSIDKSENALTIFQSNLGQVVQDLKDLGLDELAKVLQDIINSLTTVKNSITDLRTILSDTSGVIDRAFVALDDAMIMVNNLQNSGSNLRISLSSVSKSLAEVSSRIDSFNQTQLGSAIMSLANINADSVSTFMASAVKLDVQKLYPVQYYGSAVAPFYSCITFWIGGICLLALFNIEVQKPRKRRITAKEEYISRGLIFSTFALIIGLVCSLGDLLIGIQCSSIPLFLLTCMFSSVVFTMIIYTLAACFKHIGKAAAIVLVVLQIPGSSGMYPVEILPQAFQALHPFLPFTYAINALRETIVALNFQVWLGNVGMLAFMLFITVIIGLYVRNALASVNNLFDAELRKNGIIECEKKETASRHGVSATERVVELMAESKEYQDEIDKKATRFLSSYQAKRRRAIALMAIVPLLYLVALCIWFAFVEVDINTKVILMLVWVILLVVFAINIVALEYIRTKISASYTHSEEDLVALEGDDALEASREKVGVSV